MRIHWSIFILCGVLLTLPMLDRIKLPPIMLPKGAQHNTFGELPVVEVMDDGDFYEKDGGEYDCSKECSGALESYCESEYYVYQFNNDMKKKSNKGYIETKQPAHRKRTKKEIETCKAEARKACSICPPRCSDLAKIGSVWTCVGEYQGGGIGWK